MIQYACMPVEQEMILCHRATSMLLETLLLSGHPGVASAQVEEYEDTTFDTITQTISTSREFVVHVFGNFLMESAASECIEWERTTSNDIWEVLNVLGIEACAAVVFDQLKAVVSFDGTYVDERHLLMVTDTICRGGSIMPLNRHGVNRTTSSPLMKCSFEETIDILCNAAINGENENALGVTTSIMMGQLAKFGTGGTKLLFPVINSLSKKSVRKVQSEQIVLTSTCRCHEGEGTRSTLEVVQYVFNTTGDSRFKRSVSESELDDEASGTDTEMAFSREVSRVCTDGIDACITKRRRFRHVSPQREKVT